MSEPLSDKEIRLECVRLALRMHERAEVEHNILATMRMFEAFVDGRDDTEIVCIVESAITAVKKHPST